MFTSQVAAASVVVVVVVVEDDGVMLGVVEGVELGVVDSGVEPVDSGVELGVELAVVDSGVEAGVVVDVVDSVDEREVLLLTLHGPAWTLQAARAARAAKVFPRSILNQCRWEIQGFQQRLQIHHFTQG